VVGRGGVVWSTVDRVVLLGASHDHVLMRLCLSWARCDPSPRDATHAAALDADSMRALFRHRDGGRRALWLVAVGNGGAARDVRWCLQWLEKQLSGVCFAAQHPYACVLDARGCLIQ
jgi:hypothetical protein